jgi:uncharacterized protein
MKCTLITGATKGIGKELTYIYASKRHNLLLVSRTNDELISLTNELKNTYPGINVHIIPLDLAQNNSVQFIKSYCINHGLIIDTLINNAGFGDFALFEESQLKKQIDMINLNINALVELTHTFLGSIIENKGRIMLLASTASFTPIPYMSVYAGTKAFVRSFGVALNEEITTKGASVTVICPGATKTNFQDTSNLDNSNYLKFNSMASARDVAWFAYDNTARRSPIATYGFVNNLINLAIRLIPITVFAKIVKKIFEPNKK